ncbi:MAG: hypothetical protein IKO00_05085 [Oscillospiraceae bacterium]|nr:hypothetical protein [Oscillospiraceae bacterium]
MKDYRLNRALSGIDDRWLDMADPFEQEVQSMNIRHRAPRRALRTILIAAALTALFTLTAYAVSSIHAARQSELRSDLKIDADKTGSYVEYPVPTEQAPGLVLLSAVNDGQEQRVYVNISPVAEEELAAFAGGETRFSWSVEGTDLGGFAGPSLPSDLSVSGDQAIRDAILQYAYDGETQTVTLECWLFVSRVRETMEALGVDALPLQVNMTTAERTRSFGPVPFSLTEEQSRSFDFGRKVYHDAEFDKDIEIVGLELTPFSAVWKVHYEGDAQIHTPEADQAAAQDWLLLEDKICQQAQLLFSDGSTFSTGGALTTPYEDGVVNQYCGWAQAIDIADVQRIVLGDLILWEAE